MSMVVLSWFWITWALFLACILYAKGSNIKAQVIRSEERTMIDAQMKLFASIAQSIAELIRPPPPAPFEATQTAPPGHRRSSPADGGLPEPRGGRYITPQGGRCQGPGDRQEGTIIDVQAVLSASIAPTVHGSQYGTKYVTFEYSCCVLHS